VNSSGETGYHYQIKPQDDGWSWATLDADGRIHAQGAAPTKAIAAAFVIRSIARACAHQPDGA
jgi:hypothetical protein